MYVNHKSTFSNQNKSTGPASVPGEVMCGQYKQELADMTLSPDQFDMWVWCSVAVCSHSHTCVAVPP